MTESKYTYGKEVEYTIEKLTQKNIFYTENFDVGKEEINHYLKHKELDDDIGLTYLVIDQYSSVVGYCTIACSGITHRYQNNIRTIPSIEIRYFAIDSKLQKLQYDKTEEHYYFSDYVMSEFMYKCSEIAENIIAARYIILYSVEDAIKFYTRLGFCDFAEFFEADKYRYIDGCKPMYIEIP